MNHPKKELGQHWLYDETSLMAMCDAVDVKENDTVIEIGPGLGTLTAMLLTRGAHVTAVEFDESLARNLINNLKTEFELNNEQLERLSIVQKDVLKFDFTTINSPYKVVANIPYYLTSKLVRILCESSNPPTQMALLVQKEVAERVCAKAGDTSLLSVSAQVYNECSLGALVPAELFIPAPKVDSQILIMNRRSAPAVEPERMKQFFAVVKAGFSERRKKLRSSLSGGLRISKTEADELLKNADISPDVRAQELSLEDWKRLASSYNQ